MQRLEARHSAEQAEQERRREAEEKRLQDLYAFMANLQATTGIAVPPSLLAPVVRTPDPSPVSMVVYCFSLCDPPAETHEFAFPLRSHRPRVRTRLLKGTTRRIQVNLALLHSPGGQLALLHSPGGQVALLHTPGGKGGSRYLGLVSFLMFHGLRLVLDPVMDIVMVVLDVDIVMDVDVIYIVIYIVYVMDIAMDEAFM